MLCPPLFIWHHEEKFTWRTDIKVQNQINIPSSSSLLSAMARAGHHRGIRDSPAIICLQRKFLAVFLELAYVVRHRDRNIFFVLMIFLLCINAHPANSPVSAQPWGNEAHRGITHCKIRMSLLFFAALKQTVSGLLLSVLKEIRAFFKPSYSCLIPPPTAIAVVCGRSRKEQSIQPGKACC